MDDVVHTVRRIAVSTAYIRRLAAGLVVTLCRSYGCKCLGFACRIFAAAPTRATAVRTSAAACCCCRWQPPLHWVCALSAGPQCSKMPQPIPFDAPHAHCCPISSLGFSSLSIVAVLVHDGVVMSCRALSVAASHSFFKRTQSSHHQLQPLRYVVVEQGLEAFIHSVSAAIIIFMCGLRIFSLGFLEMLFMSQAASHISKASAAARALFSAISLEMSLNQVLQPVQHAPDDWCAVCFEPLGGGAHDADSAAAAATAAALGGCVRLPCSHCFHKVAPP